MVTGRIPKDFTGLWMRVSTHKYLFIFSSLHLILDGKTRIILSEQFCSFLTFLQARAELRTKKCCKENHQVLRVKWGCIFVLLAWTCCIINHHCRSVSCPISDFFRFSDFSLNVKYKWGYKKNAEFESKFFLKNESCALFSEVAMNSSLALLGNRNMEVHDHKSEFSEKYSPLVPEVLLLAVFGNITSFLSLAVKTLILSPETAAAHTAFLLLLLVNSTIRGYSVSS